MNIYTNTCGVISPRSISVIIIIVAIVTQVLIVINAVVFNIAIISVNIGEYLAIKDFPVLIGFLSKKITISILFGSNLLVSWLIGNTNLLSSIVPIGINAIIIVIRGLLIRSAGCQYYTKDYNSCCYMYSSVG